MIVYAITLEGPLTAVKQEPGNLFHFHHTFLMSLSARPCVPGPDVERFRPAAPRVMLSHPANSKHSQTGGPFNPPDALQAAD